MEGIVMVLPFGLTLALTMYTFRYTQHIIQKIFSFFGYYWPLLAKINTIPYLNLGIVVLFFIFLGYIASTIFIRSILDMIEGAVMRVPLVNILYSCIKDSTSALLDKFDKPVLITFNKDLNSKKIGFITQEKIDILPNNTKVAVYVPHSYAFSGELFLVEKEQIEYLEISTSDALRLILSGGLANIVSAEVITKDTKKYSLNPINEDLRVDKKYNKKKIQKESIDQL